MWGYLNSYNFSFVLNKIQSGEIEDIEELIQETMEKIEWKFKNVVDLNQYITLYSDLNFLGYYKPMCINTFFFVKCYLYSCKQAYSYTI